MLCLGLISGICIRTDVVGCIRWFFEGSLQEWIRWIDIEWIGKENSFIILDVVQVIRADVIGCVRWFIEGSMQGWIRWIDIEWIVKGISFINLDVVHLMI